MAEAALRRDAFDGLTPIVIKNRLTIEPSAPAARFVLRGPESAAKAAGKAFGLDLPEAINRAAQANMRAAFKLGPDEWLLVAEAEDGPALAERLAAAVQEPHSLVEVTHRNCGLSVSGSNAVDVLSTGVMLDLDPAAFPIGMATRTLFTKAEIVLWRRGLDIFHVELWRSFAPYLHGLFVEAAREYARG